MWNYIKFAFLSALFCVVPIHTKEISICTPKRISAIIFWDKFRVPTLSAKTVNMKKAGLVLGRTFWIRNSMLRVSRWCEAFQHVSVCLSVSLFNGSWVGCRAFFLPYSQLRRRWIIHVCIQKVYLRGKRFIIHSLWNQWLIVFSPQSSCAPLLSSIVHFLIADFSLCRGSEGGRQRVRERGRDTEGERSSNGTSSSAKWTPSGCRSWCFSLRGFFPFFTLERRWAAGQLLSDQCMHKLWVTVRESSVITAALTAFTRMCLRASAAFSTVASDTSTS